MRLFRENTIVVLGVMLASFPLIGIPVEWKSTAASGMGVLIAIMGFSVRRRVVVLKRKITSLYQRMNGDQ